MMANLEFLPNTPTLVNAGTGNGCAYAACYVLDVEDSLDHIFATNRKAALIQKAGGGVGMDWSSIRPRDATIKSTGYKTRGVVQFIKIYADAMSVVDQGGIRPSANMGILSVHHPDIVEFINMKHSGAAQNMNISVAVTDEFMKAKDEGKKYNLYFPVYGNREKAGELDAKDIWDKIIAMAWRVGDPGIIWIDRVNRDNPTPSLGLIRSSNPCVIGDTLIAVADGRNAISIEQLAVEGKDVPVYSRNLKTGQVEIKWGRNPRLTGEKKEVWKITLDDDSTVIATPDHKFIRRNGEKMALKDLVAGDSLMPFYTGSSAHKYRSKYRYIHEGSSSIRKSSHGAGHHKGSKINHKVKSVNFYGYEDVYNITVDDNHNYNIITSGKDHKFIVSSGVCSANCGETFLYGDEACVLGSINLASVLKKKVDVDGAVTHEWNHEKIDKLVPLAIRFLDAIIDVSPQPLQEIKDAMIKTRKIGLGVMGFADAMIKMKIQYNSMQGIEQAEHIMGYINNRAIEASVELGKEKGVFPAWELDKVGTPRRNAIVTTIAPTGSISLIAGVSSGIEPVYAMAYTRIAFGDKKLSELHVDFEEEIRRRNINIPDLFDVVFNEHAGSVQKMNISDDMKRIFVTAHDIEPEWHVRMQAAFQKHTGNSISKTINMKKDSTIEDIDEAYRLSYKLGCKGVTIYRDGSKGSQILSSGVQSQPVGQNGGFGPRVRIEAPIGRTYEIPFGYGDALITVNEDDIGLCEVIIKAGRSGSPIAAEAEVIGRLVSLLMRCNVATKNITKQLRGISAGETAFYKGGRTISSLADAVCAAIENHIEYKLPKRQNAPTKNKYENTLTYKQNCPECGMPVAHLSKCIECQSCGWSKCK
jgi:ribonucleoside-diphosphate reductase alpha chain